MICVMLAGLMGFDLHLEAPFRYGWRLSTIYIE